MNPFTIKRPVITEKSMRLASIENAYTFEVDRAANRQQIADAIEELYSVTVKKVNMIMYPATTRKTGKKRMVSTIGKVKKAVVTLAEGQKLDVFDINPTEETTK
ncbi:50S ribosomal protein L23 [Candidatus Woesebacteria bacterium]|nr:50S ribosomal protein L23 [Candidatus Woesebacteria bacterium]